MRCEIESENWDYAQSEFFICLRQFIALSEGSFAPSADNFLYLGIENAHARSYESQSSELRRLTLSDTSHNSKRYVL